MPMFPPELESTRHDGPLTPPTDPVWRIYPKVHPHAFWHGLVGFTLANAVFAWFAGGQLWHYAMALLVGSAFAFRHARKLATLKWIYGFAAGWAVVAFGVGWLWTM
jgi:hypothetical protein